MIAINSISWDVDGKNFSHALILNKNPRLWMDTNHTMSACLKVRIEKINSIISRMTFEN
jgi:hypothetical protein